MKLPRPYGGIETSLKDYQARWHKGLPLFCVNCGFNVCIDLPFCESCGVMLNLRSKRRGYDGANYFWYVYPIGWKGWRHALSDQPIFLWKGRRWI